MNTENEATREEPEAIETPKLDKTMSSPEAFTDEHPTVPQEQAQKPTNSNNLILGLVAAVVIFVVAGALGAVVGAMAFPRTVVEVQTKEVVPQACKDSIAQSDTTVSALTQFVGDTAGLLGTIYEQEAAKATIMRDADGVKAKVVADTEQRKKCEATYQGENG